MTGSDEVVEKLEEARSGLETLKLQQMRVEPTREHELQEVSQAVDGALKAVREWQREQRSEDKLATLFADIGKYTEAAHKRLSKSEERLEKIEHAAFDGRRRRPRVKQKIIDEGKYLKGVLAGPPSDADDPKYLSEASRVPIKPSIEVLADALSSRTKTTTAKTTTAKTTAKGS